MNRDTPIGAHPRSRGEDEPDGGRDTTRAGKTNFINPLDAAAVGHSLGSAVVTLLVAERLLPGGVRPAGLVPRRFCAYWPSCQSSPTTVAASRRC
jgi:hypothetical protein